MNISLYGAADQLAPLLDQIDDDGVMSDELGAALAQFEGKGISVTAYILNCEAYAKAIKDASKAMAARATPLENRANRLRQYLADSMKRTGVNEIKSPEFTANLYLERDSSVEIFDEKQLPQDYLRYPEPKPPVAVPDKKLIAMAINDGFEVPGARIVKNDRLTIK